MTEPTPESIAWTLVRGPLKLADILFQARKTSRIAPVQMVRPDRVVGEAHLATAYAYAQRAIREGRSHAKEPEVEFLRYLSGERQIKKAIEKMGILDGAETGLLVAMGDNRKDALEHFVEALGLETFDADLPADLQHLQAFGISAAQLAATTPERHGALVIEAVAAVDILTS